MSVHWILIADASRARVLSADSELKQLELVQELDHASGRLRTSELVTDHRGRTQSGPDGIPGAMDGHGDASRRDHDLFASELADFMDDGLGAARYERLVVTAPPRFLGMLRAHLSPRVAACVGVEIDRDFTRVPVIDLPEAIHRHLPV